MAPARLLLPSGVPVTVENQPWFPKWRKAVQRLMLAREALRDAKKGTSAYTKAEIEYGAA
jgi:hypothetical protein